MKAILGFFGALALAGLIWVADALLPGGPRLPEFIPILALGAGVLLTVAVLVGAHRSGVRLGGPQQWYWSLVPGWARLATVGLVIAAAVLNFTVGGTRAAAAVAPLSAFLVSALGALRTKAVLRAGRAPDLTHP